MTRPAGRHPLKQLVVLLVAAAGLACEQPPAKEIAAAQAQIEDARKAGAERYASDRWREAQAALGAAEAKVREKDYRGALTSANEAAEKARAAVQAVESARKLAASAVEVIQAEITAALEEVGTLQQEAATAKVPDEAFQELMPRVDELREELQRIEETTQRGDVLEAQKAAAELKARAIELPTAFREARVKWEAANPKAKRRRR